jgi:hypothetical protein
VAVVLTTGWQTTRQQLVAAHAETEGERRKLERLEGKWREVSDALQRTERLIATLRQDKEALVAQLRAAEQHAVAASPVLDAQQELLRASAARAADAQRQLERELTSKDAELSQARSGQMESSRRVTQVEEAYRSQLQQLALSLDRQTAKVLCG